MATETATTKKARAKAEEPEEQNEGGVSNRNVEAEAEKAQEAHDEALEILEPKAEPRRWVIGKPPEDGGTEDEYSIYIQKPLGYMSRMRFFALVSKTIAEAIKAGGQLEFGGGDFLQGEGSLSQRIANIRDTDFEDVGSFMALAMQLVAYSPDFLLECYCLWLDVPTSEKFWAKQVMNQPWDPERNKWGLKGEVGDEIIEVFIDQNYEDIRRFFAEKIPQMVARVRQRDKEAKVGRESGSAPSKR